LGRGFSDFKQVPRTHSGMCNCAPSARWPLPCAVQQAHLACVWGEGGHLPREGAWMCACFSPISATSPGLHVDCIHPRPVFVVMLFITREEFRRCKCMNKRTCSGQVSSRALNQKRRQTCPVDSPFFTLPGALIRVPSVVRRFPGRASPRAPIGQRARVAFSPTGVRVSVRISVRPLKAP